MYNEFDAVQMNEDGVNVLNTSFRLQLILVLDRSGSMSASGQINEVNDALESIETFFRGDEIDATAKHATEIAVISFGSDVTVHDLRSGGSASHGEADARAFVEAHEFRAPKLTASGLTSMGAAMRAAIKAADDRNRALAKTGMTQRKRPLIWLVSDGGANDTGWEQAAQEAISWQERGLGVVRCLATGSESEVASARASLSKFTTAAVPRLKGANWGDFIEFVTRLATTQATEINSSDGSTSQPQAQDTKGFFDFS